MLLCVAVCCSVLQCVAVCCRSISVKGSSAMHQLHCVPVVCCSSVVQGCPWSCLCVGVIEKWREREREREREVAILNNMRSDSSWSFRVALVSRIE